MKTLMAHQKTGIDFLVEHTAAGLFDEMGLGKTLQVIHAAEQLRLMGKVTQVLVICPANVKSVWHAELADFYGTTKPPYGIASYNLINSPERAHDLARWVSQGKTQLVLDESSYVKNRNAARTRGALTIRQACVGAWLLNGTPITHSPLDLWSQFCIMDRASLKRYSNFYHFKSVHCVVGGWHNKQILKYINLEELYERLQPFYLRRLKTDCLDLPKKIYSQREIPLSAVAWSKYRALRDDLVVDLDRGVVTVSQAAGRVLRLAQITSGYLPVDVDGEEKAIECELGKDKEEGLLEYLEEEAAGHHDVIVWCRFRYDIRRLAERFTQRGWKVFKIQGGQSAVERDDAVTAFSAPVIEGPRRVLLGNAQAGGLGLNLVGADLVVYYSQDYNFLSRAQSEDRAHRVGQDRNVLYTTLLATGPKGQQTVDHMTFRNLIKKEDMSGWNLTRWKEELI